MRRFTKDRMILEIKEIRELTMQKPQLSSFMYKKFSTLQSYGIMAEMRKEGFLKIQNIKGNTLYSWNFDRKLTANDFDYFYAKSLKKRASYYSKNKLKKEFENNDITSTLFGNEKKIITENSIPKKLEPIIQFKDEEVFLEPLIEVNQEEKPITEIRFDIKSKNNKILSVNIIVNIETKKVSQSKNILLHKKFKNWTNEERDKYLSIILTEEELIISKHEIENIKRLFYEENQIDLQNEVEKLKKELEINTDSLKLNKKESTKYLKLFGIKIYEKN